MADFGRCCNDETVVIPWKVVIPVVGVGLDSLPTLPAEAGRKEEEGAEVGDAKAQAEAGL